MPSGPGSGESSDTGWKMPPGPGSMDPSPPTPVEMPNSGTSEAGTSEADPDGGSSSLAELGDKCDDDEDCSWELICDRKMCIRYGVNGPLGLDCVADADSSSNPCGEFLCKDGFCRSCADDGECEGRLLCTEVEGYPGAGCRPPR